MPLTKVKSGGVSDSITLTSPDINAPDIDGGTIDNAVIGGSTAAAGSFTTITATGGSSSNWNTAYGWGDHSTQSYATQTYVGTEVSNLVDSSPAALDTLNELAAALGDDPNFATTVTNSIALKAPLASPSFTGTATMGGVEVSDTDDIRIRLLNGATFKAGIQVATTAGDMIAGSAVDDLAIRAQTNMLFATGGNAERMRIDSSGNVGIGVIPETWQSTIDALQVGLGASFAGNTTNPSRVYLSANYYINSSNQESYLATDEASQYFQNAGTHIFKVAPSGTADSAISWTTAMTVDNSGNVGIGTSSPSTKLHLGGTAPLDSIIRQDSTVSGTNWEIGEREAGKWQIFEDDSDSVVATFTSSGRVGISTSDPKSSLEVKGTFGAPATSGSAAGFISRFSQTSGVGSLDFGFGDPYSWIQSRASNNYAINFDLALQPNGGNVGIGNSSPVELLTIGSTSDTNVRALFLSSTTGAGTIQFGDGTGAAAYSGYINYTHSDNALAFATGSTERARIDSAGRLGLGVTPEAWSSVFKVLRIGTGSSIAGESGGTSTWFNTNAYYDGSWKRINTNTSAQIAHTSDGKQEFKVAASGSAGGAISWNTAVTINNSGALLVGGSVEGPGAQSGIALSGQETDSNIYIRHASGTGTGSRYMAFTYNTSQLGSITQHGTSQILFNTTSDERAKENIVDAPSASDDIDAIQVRSFDWKADGEHQKYGMIAQELQTVAPEAVSVPEDSEEMMGVDYSKLVPMLIKEIQSLRNRVAQLEE